MCMRISELGTGREAGRAGHQEVGWETYFLSSPQGHGAGQKGSGRDWPSAGLTGQVGVGRWVRTGQGIRAGGLLEEG